MVAVLFGIGGFFLYQFLKPPIKSNPMKVKDLSVAKLKNEANQNV